MNRPQTIQIFLPAGDPRGMRVAEITTRIVRVIEVPRSQLADFLKMPEAQQVGVYFLMGELSEAGLPRAYIGQSGNVGIRLVQHNQGNDRGKDFWNRALVVISLTASSVKSVGELGLRKLAKHVIQGELGDSEGAKPVGFSHGHFDLVV